MNALHLPLVKEMDEARFYLDAVVDAERVTPRRPSIVNGSIASAVEGRFGDHHRTARTGGGSLFINPLMSLLWAFDLNAVAERSLSRSVAEYTDDMGVAVAIEGFRDTVTIRPRMPIRIRR